MFIYEDALYFIQNIKGDHPEYLQPSFFATLPQTPPAFARQDGSSYTHLAPAVKIEWVTRGSRSAAALGQFRQGWDEADANLLERELKGT